jgi:hypothetical protein
LAERVGAHPLAGRDILGGGDELGCHPGEDLCGGKDDGGERDQGRHLPRQEAEPARLMQEHGAEGAA